MLDDNLYVWIMDILLDEGELTVEKIEAEYGDDSDEVVFGEEFLKRQVANDVLTRSGSSFKLVSPVELREQYRDLTEREPIDVDQIGMSPVVTIPSEMRADWYHYISEPADTQVFTLQEALHTTISAADSILRLSVPYFEISGFNILEEAFVDLAERGTTLHVLTREILNPRKEDFGHSKDLKALKELIDRYESAAREGETIHVRDFYRHLGGSNPTLDRSIHAKIAIADESLAYVGSGEIRDSSMNMNAEAGYLVGDESHASFWVDYFDFIWENADTVTREDVSEES